ncbi:hypothetical protein RsTz2092_01970 [Deferribacterales bacterium RsTz2092]|nr:hypothetical protein AGMMS49941_02260 [Deferribacterales bacterium]
MARERLVRMIVIYGDNILWRYVVPKCEPAEIETLDVIPIDVRWFTPDDLNKASEITIEYSIAGTFYARHLKFVATGVGGLFLFSKTSVAESMSLERAFVMDYPEAIHLRIVADGEKAYYLQRALSENSTEQRKISTKIRQTIMNEPVEMRNIYRFMLELNDKLDVINELLRDKHGATETELVNVRGIGISVRGFILHSDLVLADGTLAYTTNSLGTMEEKLTFSAVVALAKLKKAATGTFYQADFVQLDDDVKDAIMKYLFVRERDIMKGMR